MEAVNKGTSDSLIRRYLRCAWLLLSLSVGQQALAQHSWQVASYSELSHALQKASAGDSIKLDAGRYQGPLVITTPVHLHGSKASIIDAGGAGNGIEIRTSSTTIENIRIENWGSDLTEQNAGIYVESKNQGTVLRNIHLHGDGFGIWLQNATDCEVSGNRIQGNPAMRSQDRGNGIQLSTVRQCEVFDNTVSEVRDGLYVINSQDNLLTRNTLHDLRYGIHYMYSYDNTVTHNLAYNTRAGYALMNSRNLVVKHNVTRDSEDYGFLLNYIIHSEIDSNRIINVWTRPENQVPGREGKGFFVYNAGYNIISNNLVQRTQIGIHLTAGSENVEVFGNHFVANPVQVKYVSNQRQQWSKEQKGNYWSNYLGWDLDNNNIGDTPFEPNDGIDKLVWRYPQMKILMGSPAVLVLRWLQQRFPVTKSPGVKDSYPLMLPELRADVAEVDG